MSSHSWLLMVTVALGATVICADRTPLNFTDDLVIKTISSTTENSKPIKKWAPDPNIALADDFR